MSAAVYVLCAATSLACAALLALLVWWGPTVQTQRWQLVLASAVVLALGVEVLRRQTAAEFGTPRKEQ